MSVLKTLSRRADRPELMDDAQAGGPELSHALSQLRVLNRLFHASGPTVYGVEQLWQAAGKPRSLRVLDVGCGSGDVNRSLLRWADKRQIQITIRLVDAGAEACEAARVLHRAEQRITVVQADLFRLSDLGESADIVTATQLLHHFHGEQLLSAVRALTSVAKLGVVINDIHRHWAAWVAVWGASRLLPGNRYIRHDGPLSVAKGFRAADWEKLAADLPATQLKYSWRPLFRYAAVISRGGKGGVGNG
ncbi:methyltransferase domain-containing protein [Paenibacillus daejeonensis]|uniref:methyltransferase domain-containing protein n=1 Tax=Paenibacillus daejeonensis TaxID=135193 RepID=UPI00036213C1|nr:methyltransferase domain-containing protein [Paenibacillus daejeonensis]